MKYWLYHSRNIVGPYEWKDLLSLPGFSDAALVCPEDRYGKQKEDWRPAREIEGLVEALVEHARIRAAVSGVRERVDSLEKTRAVMAAQLGRRIKDIAALREELAEKGGHIGGLREKVEGLSSQLRSTEALRREIQESLATGAEHTKQLDALNGQVGAFRGDVSSVLAAHKEFSAELQELKEGLSALRERSVETDGQQRNRAAEMSRKIDTLGQKLEIADDKSERRWNKIDQHQEARNAIIAKKIGSLTDEIERTHTEGAQRLAQADRRQELRNKVLADKVDFLAQETAAARGEDERRAAAAQRLQTERDTALYKKIDSTAQQAEAARAENARRLDQVERHQEAGNAALAGKIEAAAQKQEAGNAALAGEIKAAAREADKGRQALHAKLAGEIATAAQVQEAGNAALAGEIEAAAQKQATGNAALAGRIEAAAREADKGRQALHAKLAGEIATAAQVQEAGNAALAGKLDALAREMEEERAQGGANARSLEALRVRVESVLGGLQEAAERDQGQAVRLEDVRSDILGKLAQAQAADQEHVRILAELKGQIDAGGEQLARELDKLMQAGGARGRELNDLRKRIGELSETSGRQAQELGEVRSKVHSIADHIGQVLAGGRRLSGVQIFGLVAGTALLAFGLWTLAVRIPAKAPSPPPPPAAPAVRRLTLPLANATALMWRDGRLWTADWMRQMVYELELKDGKLIPHRESPIPAERLTGLAASKEHLYICDGAKGMIEIRLLSKELPLVRRVASPGPSPSALFWDERYLWSADTVKRRIYQHLPDSELSVIESYAAPNGAPAAIYVDKDFFWSADAESRRLYRHQLDRSLSVLDAYEIPELSGGPQPLSGFTWRDGKAWLVRDGSPEIIVVDRKALRPVAR
ncbi:MAG: hypothetical protein ABIJ96_11180 [Elusimicrobiota bacterium]